MHIIQCSQLMRITITSAVTNKCPKIRDKISEKVAAFLDLSCKTNWTVHELHNSETCLCSCGNKDTEERAAVNE